MARPFQAAIKASPRASLTVGWGWIAWISSSAVPSAAMAAEGTAEELIHAIHPHPTVNEALGEAFMAAWNGRAINSL